MNRDEALALLVDGSSHSRLEAARVLQDVGVRDDLPILQQRLAVEPDTWVRRAIVRAITRVAPELAGGASSDVEEPPSAPAIVEEVWAEATDWVAGLFLHEIAPRVIDIGEAAKHEIEHYEASTTNRSVRRLQALMEVIGFIRRSASPPVLTEFDLTDLVVGCIATLGLSLDKRVKLGRNDPVITSGDPRLVDIALTNGVRNGLDAIDGAGDPDSRSVVLNWNTTDIDAWVTVFDDGVGLPEGARRVWDFGTTTKSRDEHLGFGLPTATLAIKSIGGDILLRPREGGGTAFEVRWPVRRETS